MNLEMLKAMSHMQLSPVVLFFVWAAIPATLLADDIGDQLKLLASHGVKSETADLVAYLQRLQPNEKLQAEIAQAIEDLSSPEFRVREDANKKLPTFGEAARAQLNEALKSKDPEVSWRAGKLLKELDSDDLAQSRQALLMATFAVLKSRGDASAAQTILATIPVLTDDTTRGAASEALWSCVDESHLEKLKSSLASKNIHQRAAAIVALEVAIPEAKPQIRKEIAHIVGRYLTDESPAIRLAAARALLDRDAESSIQTLMELISGDDENILWQADALLHLKTQQQVVPTEKQTLSGAWQAWAKANLAKADLSHVVGQQRLDLSAGRNMLEEAFAVAQASLAKGYRRFEYEADNDGAAKVADGKLRIDGSNDEGDQRVFITSQRMIGRKRWPDNLEVRAKLGGEEGNNYGWHMGVSVGRVKVLFHPGEDMGYFRAETTDEHDYIFRNEDLPFRPENDVMHEMIIRVTKTNSGADFEVTMNDGKSDKSYVRKFAVNQEQLGDYNRIGLERSGRTGGGALFDSVSIRLGR